MFRKKIFPAVILASSTTLASANVCHIEPGSVSCGSGTVTDLSGNGMVTVDGTTVLKETMVNGLLKANNATFGRLQIHGSATLTKCIINDVADFKGSVNAASSQFKNQLDIYSNLSRFIDTQIASNIHVHHTDNPKQVLHLEKNSVVSGDIIFDDGHGEVVLHGNAHVLGKVVGGKVINQ